MTTTLFTATIVGVSCGVCHVPFGLEAAHHQQLRDSHEWFYCPNGHHIHYGEKTQAEILTEQLAAEKKRTEYANERAASNYRHYEQAQRSMVAIRGHNTRLKKRVAKGACPCCHARFKDLQAHMAEQHPTYADVGER